MSAWNYEDQYSDDQEGLIVQWKEGSSKARVYLKLGHTATIEVQEYSGDRKMGPSTIQAAAVKRLRELLLFGATNE